MDWLDEADEPIVSVWGMAKPAPSSVSSALLLCFQFLFLRIKKENHLSHLPGEATLLRLTN